MDFVFSEKKQLDFRPQRKFGGKIIITLKGKTHFKKHLSNYYLKFELLVVAVFLECFEVTA